jgi:hypothetical protein
MIRHRNQSHTLTCRNCQHGASTRFAMIAIVVAALVAIGAFALYERHGKQSQPGTALLERGLSPGHRLLNQEAGRTLPSNAPRIRRADVLLTRASTRFRTSKDQVATLALKTRNAVATTQQEDVLDVLDAALFATDGLPPGRVPPLAPILAAYAQIRMDGGTVVAARNAARSFAQLAAKDMPPP